MSAQTQLAIVLGSAIIAYFIGVAFGNAIKMKDHGWKLGFVLSTIALAGSLVALRPIKQGIDLRGGVILVYEVDQEKTKDTAEAASGEELSESETKVNMDDLVKALSPRINPGGVREVVIRPYGDKQVEIIIPDVSDTEIEEIKNIISTTGFLKFRIVAKEQRNPLEWDLAQAALNAGDLSDSVKDAGGNTIGEWVMIGREETKDGKLGPLRVEPYGLLTRELLPGKVEVFVLYDDVFDVTGGHLSNVSSDFDRNGNPSVAFSLSNDGSVLFGGLTSNNLPDNSGKAPLGIVMDGNLISAPVINSTINSRGVIEGRFTQKEVDSLVSVLRSGKLPAVLHKDPISESKVSPLLGKDTIRKGKWAIGASLLGVLIFMLLYYRFAGIVACMALVANIILILGLMIMAQAALSLPGLAGLVLTVGMSVDANVLIFERIREELKKGAALRMAIRNGFGRATSTIVDANLTSLITAIVLYVVGTETIKGFAITLILGILMSLYTAIFCSRIIFDIAERKKWITSLNMTQALGETNFNFIGMRKAAAALSLVLIILGMGAVFTRGNDILDIDFTGGSSVTLKLNDAMPIEDIRTSLAGIADSVTITEVKPDDTPANTVYKVDTSDEDEKKLREKLGEILADKLKSHSLEFSPPTGLQSALQPATDARVSADRRNTNDQSSARPLRSLDGMLLAQADADAIEEAADAIGEIATETTIDATEVAADATAEAATDAAAVTDQAPPADTETPAATASTTDSAAAEISSDIEASIGGDDRPPVLTNPTASTPRGLKYQSSSKIEFDEAISAMALEGMIGDAAREIGLNDPRAQASNVEWDGVSGKGFKKWDIQFTSDAAETTKILSALKNDVSSKPVWLSSSKIGSKVAGDMKTSAITAILVSLLGIIGYIWVRFQKIGFGLAAVVALVHDVAITLGAIAVSAWLANYFGFLLIDEFRISLPIVAAFLTIIGYSLNDTIVVFDRIREVKGKSQELTEAMINKSINQTLSRTLLTSVTTLIVVIILYVFGGQGIHGFAFALLIGVLVGTYSSIFVASPALLWLTGTKPKKNARKKSKQRVGAA